MILIALFLSACATTRKGHMPERDRMRLNPIPELSTSQKVMIARITYYNKKEAGGDRLASSNGKAKEGLTIAAHPIFPFGTKVYIPALSGKIGDGVFVVQDRGTAVTKKKASKGKAFVFDVYVNVKSRKEAKKREIELERTVGSYTNVYILKDQS